MTLHWHCFRYQQHLHTTLEYEEDKAKVKGSPLCGNMTSQTDQTAAPDDTNAEPRFLPKRSKNFFTYSGSLYNRLYMAIMG